MRAIKLLCLPLFVILLADLTENATYAGEKCCECGCHYKLKKVYTPVVTFKKVKETCYTYNTVCEDVLVPTSDCCTNCGGCGACDGVGGCDCGVNCGHPGKPKKVSVPVAHPCKCEECVRKVPCVTWVVECRCEKCCNKCKKTHEKKHCSH